MGVDEGQAQMARESFWKGRSMRDVPAGLGPRPGRKTALTLVQHWCRLPQEAFLNFAPPTSQIRPRQYPTHSLSWKRVCGVVEKAEPPAHQLPLIKTHNVVRPWASPSWL